MESEEWGVGIGGCPPRPVTHIAFSIPSWYMAPFAAASDGRPCQTPLKPGEKVMRKLVLLGVIVGSLNVGYGQESVPEKANDESGPVAEVLSLPNWPPVLPKVAGRDRLLKATESHSAAVRSGTSDSRLEHLLKAAAHLEAAGEKDEACKFRQKAEKEREGLLDRLKALEAEVKRLRRLTGRAPQVLVEVKMMEFSRTKAQALGFDLSRLRGKKAGIVAAPGSAHQTSNFSIIDRGSPVFQVLEALRADKLLKVLAEPTLVTLSGTRACFHVGGQYPITALKSKGAADIEYLEYGTRMDLLATVLEDRTIRLEVRPRVAEIDCTQSTKIGEHAIPGLRVREIDTRVTMQSGQTLVIGGLIERRTVKKEAEPGGESETGKTGAAGAKAKPASEEIELLVLVTPRIVEPATTYKASTVRARYESIPQPPAVSPPERITIPSSGYSRPAGSSARLPSARNTPK